MGMFYDVPCVANISAPTHDMAGRRIKGGRMMYALFECPFDAMSFAQRNKRTQGFGRNLQVNRREWNPEILRNSRITDYRESI